MFYAHSLTGIDPSQWHTLHSHLTGTADRAGRFATPFGGASAAKACGLLHDLGKYCERFQSYIATQTGKGGDHSLAGALTLIELATTPTEKMFVRVLAYAIAGHHAGLANYDELKERIDRDDHNRADAVWRTDLNADFGSLIPPLPHLSRSDRTVSAFQLAFWGRMVFSCLVDADFKDTEAYYVAHGKATADRAWPLLNAHIDSLILGFDTQMSQIQAKAPASELNTLRQDILRHVRAQASRAPGLYTLTVPTGGGKTLASLGFALDHAKAHGLRRIIYSIPFTSIIEQSAGIFRQVLGDDYVLEHHSSIDQQKFDPKEQLNKLRLAMEDWAAPVIVTTNVQLFESLFANRPARCRKLHNIAGSVIILDEAQTLPLGLLRPTLQALDELAKHYGCTIVLCTATQPALDTGNFKHGGLDLKGRELAPDPAGLAQKLKRVHFSMAGEMDDQQLVEELSAHDQALVIVNSRKHALALYRTAKAAGLDGLVHLTTRQHAHDRREILKAVRDALKPDDPRPCRVIATSLIEAGVDVDFPRVWRAVSGLDQIAQAAGRCNREGRRDLSASLVTVFTPKDHKPPAVFEPFIDAFTRVATQFDDLLSPEAIQRYFQELYWSKGAEALDAKKILAAFSIGSGEPHLNYREVAETYRMIESGMMPVIINATSEVSGILNKLQSNAASPGKAARELQRFIVPVPPKDFTMLTNMGAVAYHRPDLWADQFAALNREELYSRETGLIWEDAETLYNYQM